MVRSSSASNKAKVIAAWERLPGGRLKAHFSVHPRYSCGSGAQVSDQQAVYVACDELDCYEAAIDGIYGAADKEKAEREGLSGIVLFMVERPKHWEIHDVLTGEVTERPFRAPRVRRG